MTLQQTYDSILKEREAAEKQLRAREAREKQERERADRAAKKRALVDFNAPDDQEGVMDSLLEALKTGSAFNREQKRKRAPRAAGGTNLTYLKPELMTHLHWRLLKRFCRRKRKQRSQNKCGSLDVDNI